jgi:hypothetical protein
VEKEWRAEQLGQVQQQLVEWIRIVEQRLERR